MGLLLLSGHCHMLLEPLSNGPTVALVITPNGSFSETLQVHCSSLGPYQLTCTIPALRPPLLSGNLTCPSMKPLLTFTHVFRRHVLIAQSYSRHERFTLNKIHPCLHSPASPPSLPNLDHPLTNLQLLRSASPSHSSSPFRLPDHWRSLPKDVKLQQKRICLSFNFYIARVQ